MVYVYLGRVTTTTPRTDVTLSLWFSGRQAATSATAVTASPPPYQMPVRRFVW